MDKKFLVGAVASLSLVALFAAVPVFKSVGPDSVKAAGEVKASQTIDEKEVMDLVETDAPKNEIDPDDTFPYDDVVKNSENMYYISGPGSASAIEENVDPDYFKDPAIREQAEKYQKKGMILTDAQRDAEVFGIGTGVGAFAFIKGFNAADDAEGNNKYFISVVKATPDEFKSFVDNYKYKLKVKKQDNGITKTTYSDSMNQIDVSYNYDTGVLEFVNEFLMEGIG